MINNLPVQKGSQKRISSKNLGQLSNHHNCYGSDNNHVFANQRENTVLLKPESWNNNVDLVRKKSCQNSCDSNVRFECYLFIFFHLFLQGDNVPGNWGQAKVL